MWVGRGSGKLEQALDLQTGNWHSLDQVASLAWTRTLPGDPCQKKMLTEPGRARLCPKWGPTPRKGARAKVGNGAQKPSRRTGRSVTLWTQGSLLSRSRPHGAIPDRTPQHPPPPPTPDGFKKGLSLHALFQENRREEAQGRQIKACLTHLDVCLLLIPPFPLPPRLLWKHPPCCSPVCFQEAEQLLCGLMSLAQVARIHVQPSSHQQITSCLPIHLRFQHSGTVVYKL